MRVPNEGGKVLCNVSGARAGPHIAERREEKRSKRATQITKKARVLYIKTVPLHAYSGEVLKQEARVERREQRG
jgi:hypothetical protein